MNKLLEEQFNIYYNNYVKDTKYLSFDKKDNYNYRKIIEMGDAAIPFLIDKIKTCNHWITLTALTDLVGQVKFPKEYYGNYEKMSNVWKNWASKNRYFSSSFGAIRFEINNKILTNVYIDKIEALFSEPTAFESKILDVIDGKSIEYIPVEFKTGTIFQKKVWAALQTIPIGKVATYKSIAEQIGMPKAARAVGNACNMNPIPIIVPCHRVISSNGKIGGYRYGIDIKEKLLQRESKYLLAKE